jgi:hypothetical protein
LAGSAVPLSRRWAGFAAKQPVVEGPQPSLLPKDLGKDMPWGFDRNPFYRDDALKHLDALDVGQVAGVVRADECGLG